MAATMYFFGAILFGGHWKHDTSSLLSVCVHAQVCMPEWVCMYVCAHTYIHTCMCMFPYVCVCLHACMLCAWIYVFVYIHVCICMCAFVYMAGPPILVYPPATCTHLFPTN